MTCIIGLIEPHRVVFAGDSMITGDAWRSESNPKVFRRGDVLYGLAGDNKACNVVEYDVALPEAVPLGMSPGKFVHKCVLPPCREKFEDYDEEDPTVELLVGTREGLVWANCSKDSHAEARHWLAIGSGGAYAMGALLAIHTRFGSVTEDDVLQTIHNVAKLDQNVGGPTYTAEIPR